MISRRNIRIKVMQLMYALETESAEKNLKSAVQKLESELLQTEKLLVYLLYVITEVARYAEKNALLRAGRNLPSIADLNVYTKISGNELLWKIIENNSFQKAISFNKPELIDSNELIKNIYVELEKSANYQQYNFQQSRNKKTEKEILQFIFTDIMLPNENFNAFIEEQFSSWNDDAEMISHLVISYLQNPDGYDLQKITGEEKKKFAKELLTTTIEKKEYLREFIKPKLKNWDAERIAMLDMILMQMGVCEFLYFKTIPPKVTINEYIDIAKEYSTEQSGHFVNGILDNIYKELAEQNKIHKIDFKQKA